MSVEELEKAIVALPEAERELTAFSAPGAADPVREPAEYIEDLRDAA